MAGVGPWGVSIQATRELKTLPLTADSEELHVYKDDWRQQLEIFLQGEADGEADKQPTKKKFHNSGNIPLPTYVIWVCNKSNENDFNKPNTPGW